MKRALISVTVGLFTLASLTACSGGTYDDEPYTQNKPAITNPQTEDLYKASSADENSLSHWVFEQKLPSGKTVTCVVARDNYKDALGITCFPPGVN